MDVRMPDGTVIQNVPEGTTQEELTRRLGLARPPAAPVTAPPEKSLIDKNLDVAAQALHGADMLPAGLQLLSKVDPMSRLLGLDKKLDAYVTERDKGMKSAEGEGFNWPKILGGVLSPAPWKLGSMLKPGFVSGAKIGGIYGAADPVTKGDFVEEKAKQIGTGAAIGGPLSMLGTALAKTGKGAYHLLEPLFKSGEEKVMGREFLAAAGEKTPDVLSKLSKPEKFIPDSRPIAGEAAAGAGSVEFSRLQQALERTTPSRYRDRGQNNVAAQDAARAERKVISDQNFGDIRSVPITADAVLLDILRRPGVNTALNEAGKMAANEPQKLSAVTDLAVRLRGDPRGKTLTHGDLDSVRQILHETAQNQLASGHGRWSRIYGGLERELSGWIDKNIAGAERARQTHEGLSTLIDRDVGRGETYREMLKFGRGDNLDDVATRGFQRETGGEPKIRVLSRFGTIVNSIVDRLEGRASERIKKEMAERALTPESVAALMRAAQTSAEKKAVMSFAMQARIPAVYGLPVVGANQGD